jgi:hypothetical protein
MYQHLDRDQVYTQELCTNRFWALWHSWRSGRPIWEVARSNPDYATTREKEACDELRSVVGHSVNVCNNRRSVGECWIYFTRTVRKRSG